jgi:hypothetical protein
MNMDIFEPGVDRNKVFDLSSINLEENSFTITGAGGFGVINIKQKNNVYSTFRFYSKDLELTYFDINKVSKEARDQAVMILKKYDFSYSQIADILGLTPSTVNNIIRKLK